jgi:hypothetical protein
MEIAGAGNEAMLFFRLKEEKTVGKNEKRE